MTTGTAVWVYLIAAAILAAWALARFPDAGPRAVPVALGLFLGGQLAPYAGLLVLPPVLRLADGAQLALPLVVLPCFFVAWLTIGWLVRAILESAGRAERHS